MTQQLLARLLAARVIIDELLGAATVDEVTRRLLAVEIVSAYQDGQLDVYREETARWLAMRVPGDERCGRTLPVPCDHPKRDHHGLVGRCHGLGCACVEFVVSAGTPK